MFAPFLLTIVLASANADDPSDAVALIKQLGAASFDDRVAAYKALERLGGAALPALRAVADTSDMRVRSRVLALIESIGRQIEAERFARPTMIQFDIRARPLGAVVEALNDRYDLGLSLRLGPLPRRGMMGRIHDPDEPKRLEELKARPIRPRAAGPLPFWEAIDRLCEAGALRYDVAPRPNFGSSHGSLVLIADRTGRGPVSDSGPFRVQITRVQSVFERDFTLDPERARRGPKPPGAGDLTVPLTVLPEPGLMLHQNGAVMITEATDDRGRSLVPSTPAHLEPTQPNHYFQVMSEQTAVQVNAVLAVPDPPGTVIRRLRGKVPVIAVTKGSDPIVIRLTGEGVAGKSISTRDMTLVVDEVVLAAGAAASITMTIRPNRASLAAGARPDPGRPDFTAFNLDRVLEHVQLHDAAGRRLNHRRNGQRRGADGGLYDRYRLTVSPGSDDNPLNRPKTSKPAIPSELRYYGFVQKVMEVPFDFRDVPMP